jgi:methylamine dehydrogenase accessory protein MauD
MTSLMISNTLLWLVVLGLLVVVWALARQIGVLYERIAPMGALISDAGPKLGEPAPVLTVSTLSGQTMKVGAASGTDTLIFFVSTTCPVCKKMLPVLRSMAQSESQRLKVLLASDGEMAEHAAFYQDAKLAPFPYLLSGELGMTYRVSRLPYAVLIDGQGVLRAKGLINTREHLDSLLTARDLGVGSVQEYLEVRREKDERA